MPGSMSNRGNERNETPDRNNNTNRGQDEPPSNVHGNQGEFNREGMSRAIYKLGLFYIALFKLRVRHIDGIAFPARQETRRNRETRENQAPASIRGFPQSPKSAKIKV
jgi:hypothetical protein